MKYFTLLILTLFTSSILAQSFNFNQGSIIQKKYLQKIPYQNINGKIVVQVSINGKMHNFVIDTGASLAISDRLFKELNLQIMGQTEIADMSGRKKEMKIILLPELHLQGITFIDTPGCVFHEESSDFINPLECLGIDGIIGSNMLRNSVIQFDEQSKHVIISNNMFQIPKNKIVKSQKIKLSPSQSSPYIRVALQKNGRKRIGDYVLFDTGASNLYNMSIRTYDWLNGRADVTKITETEGSFAWGFHGTFEKQRHILLSIPELHVNQMIFKDVIATTTYSISLMGTRLLQYGKTTLDYKRKFFYFEPYENINTDELSEKPSAFIPTWQNDKKFVVGIIWDKSLESQINLGDEILSINGFDIEKMEFCDVVKFNIPLNNEKEPLEIEFRDINTGEIKKVKK